MPTTVAEATTFTTIVQVPNDAEPATQASLLLMAQPLANRTKWLKAQLESGVTWPNASISTWMSGASATFNPGSQLIVNGSAAFGLVTVDVAGNMVFASNASLTLNPNSNFVLPAPGKATFAATSFQRAAVEAPYFHHETFWNWERADYDEPYLMTQYSVAGTGTVAYRLKLPKGAYLTQVLVYVKPATTHVGMTFARPTIRLSSVVAATGIATYGDEKTDIQNTLGAYQTTHPISLAAGTANEVPLAFSPTGPETAHYELHVTGEAGAQAMAGLSIVGIVLYYTMSTLDYAL